GALAVAHPCLGPLTKLLDRLRIDAGHGVLSLRLLRPRPAASAALVHLCAGSAARAAPGGPLAASLIAIALAPLARALDALDAIPPHLSLVRTVVLAALRALDAGVRDAPRDELDRPDRVVVAGDHVVDQIRIAVGVRDGDDRDAQLARLADRDRLLVRIDHEHRVRHRPHALQAAEVLLQALALFFELGHLFLEELLVCPVLLHALGRPP